MSAYRVYGLILHIGEGTHIKKKKKKKKNRKRKRKSGGRRK
jgi:hypothetical protein